MRKSREQRCKVKNLHQPDQNWVQTEVGTDKVEIPLTLKQYEAGYLWRDRRSGFERRQLRDRRSQSGQCRGGGRRSQTGRRMKDRRCPESPAVIEYRRARTQLREQLRAYHTEHPFKRWVAGGITVAALMLLGVIALLFLGNKVHCNTPPRPSVNWSTCLLSERVLAAADLTEANLHNSSLKGADLHNALLTSAILTYANLTFTNLRYADLSGAILRGANLRGADLSYAKLNDADLSYADLSDANLEGTSLQGAKLGYAIWYNRRECAPGSISICQ